MDDYHDDLDTAVKSFVKTYESAPKKFMLFSSMNPAEYNVRSRLPAGSDAYEALKANILHYGNVQPIVVNTRTNNTIVGGHQRYWLMRDHPDLNLMGDEVILVDLSLRDEQILNLALNRHVGVDDAVRYAKLISGYDEEEKRLFFLEEDAAATVLKTAAIVLDGSSDVTAVRDAFRETEHYQDVVPMPYGNPQASSATTFIEDDFDIDSIGKTKASIGGAELKGDHPHRTGEQTFEVTLVFTLEQRDLFMRAVKEAKATYGLPTAMEAVVVICEQFLLSQGV